MVSYALGERRLRGLGIEVSKLREELRNSALLESRKEASDLQRDVHEVSRLARRMSRGEFREGALD